MKTRTLIGLGVAAALAAGIGAYSFTAHAQYGGGYGPGMMGGGYGPGMMDGNGPGNGYGPGYGHMRGFGPGNNGEGYGPGYHMRGYGPGMMQGYGRGYGPRADVQGNQTNQTLNLTTDEVKSRMERWLARRDNPRLKVGEVKEKDADTIIADIVTKDNSLVQRFIVDRHTGFVRQDNS
jgi:hypothetical protein